MPAFFALFCRSTESCSQQRTAVMGGLRFALSHGSLLLGSMSGGPSSCTYEAFPSTREILLHWELHFHSDHNYTLQ